jgi:hypothetical protein
MKELSVMPEPMLIPELNVGGSGMLVTGRQMAAARALVGIAQPVLSEESGVALSTIRNMEAALDKPIAAHTSTVRKVQAALESRGVVFLNDRSPGVRLRAP